MMEYAHGPLHLCFELKLHCSPILSPFNMYMCISISKPQLQIIPFMEVVELKVRLHCKACEKSVRKTLSKLKGVTCVEIDVISSKLTVLGYIDQNSVIKQYAKLEELHQTGHIIVIPLTMVTSYALAVNLEEELQYQARHKHTAKKPKLQ